ncbi:MAG: secretion system protein [Acidimicrobiales bacterium]
MTAALAFGGAMGAGVAVLVWALVPKVVSLAGALDRLEGRGVERMVSVGPSGPRAWREAVAARLASGLVANAWLSVRLGPDLVASGLSAADLMGEALVGVTGGAVLPWVTGAVLLVGGVRVPTEILGLCSVVLAAMGMVMPVVVVRAQARDRRGHLRHVLGSFCDLVALGLAAGAGVEGALEGPGVIGSDWALTRIQVSLEEARLTGAAPWEALVSLGEAIGVEELAELGANLSLAGTEGARVRATLRAKATSLRRHELERAETEANALTERMFVPGTLLLAGFLIFLAYPALARIFGQL